MIKGHRSHPITVLQLKQLFFLLCQPNNPKNKIQTTYLGEEVREKMNENSLVIKKKLGGIAMGWPEVEK